VRSRYAAVGLLTALVLADCGTSSDVSVSNAPAHTTSETDVVTTSTDASGDVSFRTLTAGGNGAAYTIGVPDSWSTVDPSAGTPEEVAAKIAELFPNGVDPTSLAYAIRQGLVLFAIDPVSGANVNVLLLEQTVSLDALARQVDDQLTSIGAAPADITHVTIAGRDALRADTTITKPSARLTQLYVVTDTQTYVTTITTPRATNGVPVDAMADSIAIA
jgi:hypothetical protein